MYTNKSSLNQLYYFYLSFVIGFRVGFLGVFFGYFTLTTGLCYIKTKTFKSDVNLEGINLQDL